MKYFVNKLTHRRHWTVFKLPSANMSIPSFLSLFLKLSCNISDQKRLACRSSIAFKIILVTPQSTKLLRSQAQSDTLTSSSAWLRQWHMGVKFTWSPWLFKVWEALKCVDSIKSSVRWLFFLRFWPILNCHKVWMCAWKDVCRFCLPVMDLWPAQCPVIMHVFFVILLVVIRHMTF